MAKRVKDLRDAADTDKVLVDAAKKTDDLTKKGDRKATNVERLGKTAADLTVNLPQEEAARLKKGMEKAYQDGANDFERTAKEQEKHLGDQDKSRKEFGQAEKDAASDSKRVQQTQREVKQAPFEGDLRQMSQNLSKVSDQFKEAGRGMDKDIDKGKTETRKQGDRVKQARPKMRFEETDRISESLQMGNDFTNDSLLLGGTSKEITSRQTVQTLDEVKTAIDSVVRSDKQQQSSLEKMLSSIEVHTDSEGKINTYDEQLLEAENRKRDQAEIDHTRQEHERLYYYNTKKEKESADKPYHYETKLKPYLKPYKKRP
jgi:hypothetical protein